MTCGITFTFGGLKIDTDTHVLDIVALLRNRYDAEIAELRDDIRELRELVAR